MRIHHAATARAGTWRSPNKINTTMPAVGSDQQRGGWYDVVERVRKPGQEAHPLHLARPQGLVAAGAGHPGLPDHGRLDRQRGGAPTRSRGGGVLQRLVLRLRGGLGLLQRPRQRHPLPARDGAPEGQPLDGRLPLVRAGLPRRRSTRTSSSPRSRWTCTSARSRAPCKDDILRVSPDILPPGSIRIGEVEVDGEPYADFDADGADRPGAGGQEAGQDPRPGRADHRSVRGPHQVRRRCRRDDACRASSTPARSAIFQARGRGRPRQEARPSSSCNLQDLESIANVGHPGAALRPPADGHLGPGRHLRGRAERPRSARRSCAPTRTRRTSTSSRATTRSGTATSRASDPS